MDGCVQLCLQVEHERAGRGGNSGAAAELWDRANFRALARMYHCSVLWFILICYLCFITHNTVSPSDELTAQADQLKRSHRA